MKDKPVILVVYDKLQNIELLEAYLVPQGYEIVKAANGEEALEKLSANQIDLMLLDVMMLGMDGLEVTRQVRQDNTHRLLPIILVTSFRETEDRVKGIEAGCDDFLSKPVDKMELLARVRSLLKVKAYNDLMINYRKELESEVTGKTEELKRALENLQQEITERKRMERSIRSSLKEKEVILKEVHHRVKNNMQVIVSMLNLQSRYVDDEQAIEAFRKSQDRIRTMALVHEKLYQTNDLARIDFAEYTRDLANYLLSAYGAAADAITLKMDIENVSLGIDTALPCGMILNELITNSITHAFPGGRRGDIFIELHSDNNNLILTAGDNGAGIPEDLDLRNTESMGLPLIDAFVEQLEGSVELNRKVGTEFRMTFPMSKYDKR